MQTPDAKKSYGTVSPDTLRQLSGLEFVEGLATGALPLNPMARTLGYDVVAVEKGRVVITAEPEEAHFNPWGTVHGGLAATLLDSCMGLAIQSTVDRGIVSTTLEFKISFIRPITTDTGLIHAEGKVLGSGRRAGTAEGRVTDGKGRLLAHGTTTCLIFEVPAP
ncbi:PaaI family thioesterase [uncultured Methylibium sp.]|uniref:PaaI family thioesterase n=1 Tax=uncultured Methylibium sp. TaxID=381093 RepID=UPI0025EE0D03|nr:PaaI family thioesterase [uncultured Methylibium sp.]